MSEENISSAAAVRAGRVGRWLDEEPGRAGLGVYITHAVISGHRIVTHLKLENQGRDGTHLSLSLSSRGSGRVCYFRCLRRRRDGTTSTTASSGLDAPMRYLYLEVDVELTKARETRVGMVHAWPSGARSDPRPDYCSSRCSQISLSAKKSRGNQGDAVQSARHTLVRVKPGRWRRVHRPGGRGRDPFAMRTGWTRAVRRPRPPGGSYRVRQTRPHPS